MSAVPKPTPSRHERSARFDGETLTFIPESSRIRPLRDVLVVEPLEVDFGVSFLIDHEHKPVRGIVRAVGPGTYPKRYDHPDKHRRSRMWESKRFQPTEVKVGDVVELGGLEQRGYLFETFYWGDVLHVICREVDVCGVRERKNRKLA